MSMWPKDIEDAAHSIVADFTQKKLLIATAESCTAGLIAGAITEIAGSSTVFDRGFVTYSNEAKREMIGVANATLKAHGAVSRPTALEMAQETGKIVSWVKKEGDAVRKGEILLEVETDKAVVEIEASADGILGGIQSQAGAVVPVGTTIAWILAPGENVPAEAPASAPAARTDQTSSPLSPIARSATAGLRAFIGERRSTSIAAAASAEPRASRGHRSSRQPL